MKYLQTAYDSIDSNDEFILKHLERSKILINKLLIFGQVLGLVCIFMTPEIWYVTLLCVMGNFHLLYLIDKYSKIIVPYIGVWLCLML